MYVCVYIYIHIDAILSRRGSDREITCLLLKPDSFSGLRSPLGGMAVLSPNGHAELGPLGLRWCGFGQQCVLADSLHQGMATPKQRTYKQRLCTWVG